MSLVGWEGDWNVLKKLRIPKQKTLPDVLTIGEVQQLIAAIRQHRNAAYFWWVYSLGLRLQEGLNLQIGDLDSQRMMVHIHRGKGAKDRTCRCPTARWRSFANTGRRIAVPPGSSRRSDATNKEARPPQRPWMPPRCKVASNGSWNNAMHQVYLHAHVAS